MTAPRRLLTIGHSYCVRRNRELAEALVVAGDGSWEVTVAAPATFPGDFGPVTTTADADERAALRLLPVRRAKHVHVMTYGHGLRALLAEPWDVVHCWEEPFVVAAAQIARHTRPSSALIFATFQNLAKRYPPPFGAVERFAMGRARGWIAFGQTVAATLEARREYAGRRHAVIPFGVDVTRFAPDATSRRGTRARLEWEAGDAPVVGFLGRFVEEKGLPLLIEVLDRLERRGVKWRALFVGGGPLEPALRALAARHPGRVAVVTNVRHDEVPPYLRAMDVLCAPSRSTPKWREQFGRMIVEAFACGVPVVGSDCGEIPNVIGDAGLVVGERDTAGWESALATLLTDEGSRRALAGRGLARARSTFAWSVVARQHLDFFERVSTA